MFVQNEMFLTSAVRKAFFISFIYLFFLCVLYVCLEIYFCCYHFFFRRILGGAWLVAYRAEQRRRFKAVICAGDPRFSSKSPIKTFKREESQTTDEDLKTHKLDGFYLVNGRERRSLLNLLYRCNAILNKRIL